MATITKIEDQKNKKRFNIFVDDAFFCGVNKETAILFGLKEGKSVNETELQEMIFESDVKMAFEKAVDYLSFRMHSRYELYEKLLKKEYERNVINSALDKLEEYGYINDEEFVKQAISQNTKYSSKILENKLKMRGISSELIEKYMADSDNLIDNDQFLCEKAIKKYAKTKDIKIFENKQKMIASLIRKGFDFELINRTLKQIEID